MKQRSSEQGVLGERASYLFGRIISRALVFRGIQTLVLFTLELFLAPDIVIDVGHDVGYLLDCCCR